MKILIAEDEENISLIYKITLESRGHEVIVTKDGLRCIDEYMRHIKNQAQQDQRHVPPFDAVVLDYRMPGMDGMDAAKHILKIRPRQRIIFASAFVKDTLVESIKELDQVVELLQKPFEVDVLVDTVEDKTIYERLSKLNVDIIHLKDWNPTHIQIKDLLDGLLKLRKSGFDFRDVVAPKSKINHVAHKANSATR